MSSGEVFFARFALMTRETASLLGVGDRLSRTYSMNKFYHRKLTYLEEYVALLKLLNIEYDERFLFG